MEHLPGGHEPRRLGQQPLSQLRAAGRRPHSPSRPTSSAAAAQERRGGQREAREGTNGQVATTAVPLRGQCLSDYIHSDSKLPECCNLLSCHVSVPSLFLCHLGNLKALVQPGHCPTVCVEPKRGEVCPSTCHRTCSSLPSYLYSARRPHHQVVA